MLLLPSTCVADPCVCAHASLVLCTYTPTGEDEHGEGSTANITTAFLFHDGRPLIALYATRAIGKNEEIVSMYGGEFWEVSDGHVCAGDGAMERAMPPC